MQKLETFGVVAPLLAAIYVDCAEAAFLVRVSVFLLVLAALGVLMAVVRKAERAYKINSNLSSR